MTIEKPNQLPSAQDHVANNQDETSSGNMTSDSVPVMEKDAPSLNHTHDGQQTPTSTGKNENPDAKAVAVDENAVNWTGEDDPRSPQNWTSRRKWANVGALSVMTILTPLGSSMFAPGVPDIMAEFHSHDSATATLVVSIYVLGFAFGPLLAAPLSETYGRAICYNVSNVFYIIFTVATALSQNMGMLIAFRFLMGFAGSTPITNGSGTIADMFPVQERGKALSVWALGPLLGPCVGPVAGGYVVERLGWRWVFWIIAIAAGVISVACFFLVVETHHPTLLRKEVKRMKKETGNQDLYCALDDPTMTASRRLQRAIIRPGKLLLTNPPTTIMSLYLAIAYGILYLLFSTFTFVYGSKYGFSDGTVGLTYLPTGIGMFLGLAFIGPTTDKLVKKKLDQGKRPTPEDRIPLYLLIPTGLCMPIALFWYGWSIMAGTHWIVPMLAESLFAIGMICIFMLVQTYLIDCFPKFAASMVAAITVLRSVLGALLPLSGLKLYESLGYGWGNSLLGFIALACIPIPTLFYFRGAQMRERFPVQLE